MRAVLLCIYLSVAFGAATPLSQGQDPAPAGSPGLQNAADGGATTSSRAPEFQKTYLYEVVRYLYRWYLDERDVEGLPAEITFQVRALQPQLDPGDLSLFAEIVIPELRFRVLVKKPDYVIEETGTEVKGRDFAIYRVSREEAAEAAPEGKVTVLASMADLREYLFRTRAQVEFPDQALFERLRGTLRTRFQEAGQAPAVGAQTIYMAPLSPVANDWWVYWENRKLLIRFSSDIDLTNPEVWEHEQIGIDHWDTYNQVVVTMDEVPGSNEFLTRDQIGRALYNCLVLGKREEVVPPAK